METLPTTFHLVFCRIVEYFHTKIECLVRSYLCAYAGVSGSEGEGLAWGKDDKQGCPAHKTSSKVASTSFKRSGMHICLC